MFQLLVGDLPCELERGVYRNDVAVADPALVLPARRRQRIAGLRHQLRRSRIPSPSSQAPSGKQSKIVMISPARQKPEKFLSFAYAPPEPLDPAAVGVSPRSVPI